MLMESVGKLFKNTLIKFAVPAAVCLVSIAMVIGIALCETGKLIKGCYIFLKTKITRK